MINMAAQLLIRLTGSCKHYWFSLYFRGLNDCSSTWKPSFNIAIYWFSVVNETTKGSSDLFTFSPAVWLLAMKWYVTPGSKLHEWGYYPWHLLIDTLNLNLNLIIQDKDTDKGRRGEASPIIMRQLVWVGYCSGDNSPRDILLPAMAKWRLPMIAQAWAFHGVYIHT